MANLGMPSDMDSILRTIPSGVDPFAYIARLTISKLSLTSSKYTIGILLGLLFFHSLIVLFCMFLLTMSYVSGVKHARWFIKSLYINDRRGQKVYNCPLYFINAGILMTTSQMLCSAAAGTYIGIQIKSAQSPEYAVDAPLFPPLGVMCIFETFSHWSVTHCFLVTVYVSRGFHQEMRSGLLGWISPPILINLVFFGVPVVGTTIAAGMFAWITLSHHELAMGVMKALDGLKQGSLAWKQLNKKPPPSGETISRIAIQLVQTIPKLKKIYTDIGTRAERFLYSFHRCQLTLMVIACTTCLIFIFIFFVLLSKHGKNDEETDSNCVVALPRSGNSLSWLKRSLLRGTGSGTPNTSTFRLLMANRQLVYLFLRAFGVFLSMMTQLATCSIFIIKNDAVILDNHWREIGTWLVIVSGTWSAIPIAWQCWRLYVDQTSNEPPPVANKKQPPKPPRKPLKFAEIMELEMRREKELAMRLEKDLMRDPDDQDLEMGQENDVEKQLEVKLEKYLEARLDEDIEITLENDPQTPRQV